MHRRIAESQGIVWILAIGWTGLILIDFKEFAMQGVGATLFPTMLVSDVMEKWPQTIQVFVRLRMACPGCPIARFHTLAEVAAEYQMDPATLLKELQECVDAPYDDNSTG